MPRRYADYLPTDGFQALNVVSTIGAFILGLPILPFTWNVLKSRRYGEPVTVDDPWGYGNSLEWATSCPPPRHGCAPKPTSAAPPSGPPSDCPLKGVVVRLTLSGSVCQSIPGMPVGAEHLHGAQERRRQLDLASRLRAIRTIRQSKPRISRSVMYLTISDAEMCGMSLSGPILLSCTAVRNRSAGARDPLIGCWGCW